MGCISSKQARQVASDILNLADLLVQSKQAPDREKHLICLLRLQRAGLKGLEKEILDQAIQKEIDQGSEQI